MKKYFILAAAALTLAACSNEESDNRVDNNVIRLTANMGEPTLTRAEVSIQSTAFDENELVKIEITPNGGSMSAKVYKAGAASSNVNGLTVNTGDAFTWPASGTVGIKAFYPSSVGSSTTSFTVSTDQSTAGSATGATDAEKGYKGSDLMYATASITKSGTSSTGALTFTHKLSKIVVSATAGAGVSKILEVRIIGGYRTINISTPSTCTLGSTLSDANSASTYITMYSSGTSTTANCAAIIPPQTISGQFLQIVRR